MAAFAVGKFAIRFCDRCDQKYRYNELQRQVINGVVTQLLVCPRCLDEDQPQYQISKLRIADPQALQDARPDRGIPVSRGLFGWNPVLGFLVSGRLGSVAAI